MSRRSALLTLSLAANLALAAAFLARPATTATYFRGLFSPPAAVEPPRVIPPRAAAAPAVADGVTAFAWTDADATDFVGLVGRLRAAGFPPAVVRNVVSMLIGRQFAERQRDILRARAPEKFWQNSRTDVAKNLEIESRMRALNREREKLLKDVLGSDSNQMRLDDPWVGMNRERQFGSIPTEKIEQFYKIASDYNELTQKVLEDTLGIMLPEDRAKLALLEKEKQADIARLFTPDELAEYELRNSEAANRVRNRADRFDLTEAEFRALYAAEKNIEGAEAPSASARGSGQPRPPLLDAAFREVLGDERYAAMKQANNPNLERGDPAILTRLMLRLNLDPAAVPNVIAVQQDIQQRANAVRANTALTLGERSDQLSALATEAATKLTPLLGATGFEAYQQNGGQWLNGLRNAPRTLRGGFGPNN